VLKGFSAETRQRLQRLANIRKWREGEVVLRGGAVAAAVCVVLEGRLRLAGISTEGDELLFRWFLPGEYVGLSSAIGDVPFLIDAVASGDCRCAHFESAQFKQILAADGAAAMLVASQVSRLAHDMTRLVIAHAEHSLAARVMAVLLRLAMHNSTRGPLGQRILPLSQSDIAKAVGASRQRVSIELSKLEKEGRIRLGYGHIILVDPTFEHAP
jgi:CRP-like cAMP-binding protein